MDTALRVLQQAKLQPLQVEGTLEFSQAPVGLFGRWSSARAVSDVAFVYVSFLDALSTLRP